MKVRDIMTTDLAVADPDTTIEEIASIMKEENVGSIPVCEEDDELVGIITDRDIVVRCIAEGKDPAEVTAEEFVSGELHTIGPESNTEDVSRIMAEKQVRRVPVVEDGKLIGMVSLGDVAVKAKDDDLSGATLEDVSEGVKPSRGRARASSSKPDNARKDKQEPRSARSDWRPDEANKQEQQKQQPQRGASASGRQGSTDASRTGTRNSAKSIGSKKLERGQAQGISSHSAREENARQDKVVPFRSANTVDSRSKGDMGARTQPKNYPEAERKAKHTQTREEKRVRLGSKGANRKKRA
jgi:CBS domain-containing protein